MEPLLKFAQHVPQSSAAAIPGGARDLSLVVAEGTAYEQIERLIRSLDLRIWRVGVCDDVSGSRWRRDEVDYGDADFRSPAATLTSEQVEGGAEGGGGSAGNWGDVEGVRRSYAPMGLNSGNENPGCAWATVLRPCRCRGCGVLKHTLHQIHRSDHSRVNLSTL